MASSPYLSNQEAAEYLGLSVNTLNFWRVRDRGPRYTKLGNLVKYRLSDLEAFAQATAVDTSESLAAP